MIDLNDYIKKGLIKKRNPNFRQIVLQLAKAQNDIEAVNLLKDKFPEWAAALAYHSMLRAGRALMYAYGYLPCDGQQHVTVVKITGKLLGQEMTNVISKFNLMRKARNKFLYDSIGTNNPTETELALKNAKILLNRINDEILKLNPQTNIDLK